MKKEKKIRSKHIDKEIKKHSSFNLLWVNPLISVNMIIILYISHFYINKDNFIWILLIDLFLMIGLTRSIILLYYEYQKESSKKLFNKLIIQTLKTDNYLHLNYLLIDLNFSNVRTIFESCNNIKYLDLKLINKNSKKYIRYLQKKY